MVKPQVKAYIARYINPRERANNPEMCARNPRTRYINPPKAISYDPNTTAYILIPYLLT